MLYTDNTPQFAEVCRLDHILPETSQPGVPQTNTIIESANQDIVIGTLALLALAGMPACLWVFAAPCYCMHDNITDRANGEISAWKKKCGVDFVGLRLPLAVR